MKLGVRTLWRCTQRLNGSGPLACEAWSCRSHCNEPASAVPQAFWHVTPRSADACSSDKPEENQWRDSHVCCWTSMLRGFQRHSAILFSRGNIPTSRKGKIPFRSKRRASCARSEAFYRAARRVVVTWRNARRSIFRNRVGPRCAHGSLSMVATSTTDR